MNTPHGVLMKLLRFVFDARSIGQQESRHVMPNGKQLVLYCSPEKTFRDSPYNAGFESVLPRCVERGATVIDPSQLSNGEHYKAYSDSTNGPATRKKQRVRPVFGSHKYPGSQFGLGVPALVVLDEQGRALEIYPHMDSGRLVTIADAVAQLTA